mmetsp:Transcript_27777/g.94585  ORF Transcript_27777/g.94585 Transcript_27777/m.94585 type:complete len:216 (+) Transcript_27777:394-1041(+)
MSSPKSAATASTSREKQRSATAQTRPSRTASGTVARRPKSRYARRHAPPSRTLRRFPPWGSAWSTPVSRSCESVQRMPRSRSSRSSARSPAPSRTPSRRSPSTQSMATTASPQSASTPAGIIDGSRARMPASKAPTKAPASACASAASTSPRRSASRRYSSVSNWSSGKMLPRSASRSESSVNVRDPSPLRTGNAPRARDRRPAEPTAGNATVSR